MTKCSKCGKEHSPRHPCLKSKLTDKGFPEHPNKKAYLSAHEQADKAEKKKFGEKNYVAMQKVDSKLPRNELSGKNTRSGKIEVSRKVPPKYRSEVAYHEKVENKILRKKGKK
jgi:hypothetical protein